MYKRFLFALDLDGTVMGKDGHTLIINIKTIDEFLKVI